MALGGEVVAPTAPFEIQTPRGLACPIGLACLSTRPKREGASMSAITKGTGAPPNGRRSRPERALARAPSKSPPWTGWLIAIMVATVLLYAIDIVFAPLPS